MRKAFFVSRGFPFDRVIYPGSGPGFGRAYGWSVHRIDEMPAVECDVGVVENRLLAEDVAHLDRFLALPAGRRFPVFFKISDPEMPLSRDEGVRWIFAQRDHPGVHYLSVYEPAGPVREVFAGLTSSRVVRAPYPYDAAREIDRPLGQRSRRVFLSGARNRRLYPFREEMFRRHAWNPLARRALVRLRHPGYPDIGATPRHDVVGPRFVERAARYTHFFLDPSRYGVELMKYTECAYARSVPLGDLPSSLASAVGWCFVRSRGRTGDVLRAVRAPLDEMEAMAGEYRRALRAARDPARLNAEIDDQIGRLP